LILEASGQRDHLNQHVSLIRNLDDTQRWI
jgi:hypothetical protein